VYKIRRISDGLFADGKGSFSAKGKAWTNVGHIKNHINSRIIGWGPSQYDVNLYAGCELVMLEMVEVEINAAFVPDTIAAAVAKEEQRKAENDEWTERRRLADIAASEARRAIMDRPLPQTPTQAPTRVAAQPIIAIKFTNAKSNTKETTGEIPAYQTLSLLDKIQQGMFDEE
jgi:hypothetical protein